MVEIVEARSCGNCGNDEFRLGVTKWGWLKIICLQCGEQHDPDEPSDFQA